LPLKEWRLIGVSFWKLYGWPAACIIELGFDPASGAGGPVRTAYVLEFIGRGMIVTDSYIAVQRSEWDSDSAIDLGEGGVL
jgi:hypothetical protein